MSTDYAEILRGCCPDVLHPELRPSAGLFVRVGAGAGPRQGWKLHVSANVATAEEVLRRVAPVLAARGVPFKVVRSSDGLSALNQGVAGLGQVGKLLTAYPPDDAAATALAAELDRATRGLDGPAVRTDRRLHRDSLVSYRYGGFEGRWMQTAEGQVVAALDGPHDSVVPDRRDVGYHPPEGVPDPFVAAGVARADEEVDGPVGGRFLRVQTLHESPRGGVSLAIDLRDLRRCVLKRSMRAGEGADALRREHHALTALAPDAGAPVAIELVEERDQLYLVIEDLGGVSLEQHLSHRLAPQEVVELGRRLAAAVGAIHARGWVHRDLKAANVVQGEDGGLRPIDFELAAPLGAPDPPRGGTPGYTSPQQASGAPADPTDDVYALGALLYRAATGAAPSESPGRVAVNRPVRWVRPELPEELAAVIERALALERSDRYPTPAALGDALAEASLDVPAAPYGSLDGRCARERSLGWARALGEGLCARLVDTPTGLAAVPTLAHAPGIPLRDVASGTAGVVLALVELADAFGDPFVDAARGAARWLRASPRFEGPPLPGLYVGESGVALALLRAGSALGEAAWVEEAVERSRWIATLPHASLDLYNGTAGRLRFHLAVAAATGDRAALDAAVAAGRVLLAAERRDDPWFGRGSLGYAHGAAGIADAALDLYEQTREPRLLELADRVARGLEDEARPCCPEVDGVDWPAWAGGPLLAPAWCHGAAGISRFLLHRGRVPGGEAARATALRAVRATARGARFLGPVLCHGLCGSIDALVDAYRDTGDPSHLAEARSLADLVERFHCATPAGWAVTSDRGQPPSPDLSIGFAGVAVTWLRLAEPDARPHLLSLPRFRAQR